jgi:predicted nicotinamide N-methyase
MSRSDNHPADHFFVRAGALRVELRGPAAPPGERGERLTLWWGVTSAAQALAERLATGPSMAGVRAVELGCGLGLAGIAAGLRGAHVTFTDGEPAALAHAASNAARNGLPAERITTALLDWDQPGEVGSFDLLLGAEIGYDYLTHGALVALIPSLLAPGGRALLADRRRLVVDRWIGRLRGRGLAVEIAERTVEHEGLPRQRISLFELTRRG